MDLNIAARVTTIRAGDGIAASAVKSSADFDLAATCVGRADTVSAAADGCSSKAICDC